MQKACFGSYLISDLQNKIIPNPCEIFTSILCEKKASMLCHVCRQSDKQKVLFRYECSSCVKYNFMVGEKCSFCEFEKTIHTNNIFC